MYRGQVSLPGWNRGWRGRCARNGFCNLGHQPRLTGHTRDACQVAFVRAESALQKRTAIA
eukprot:9374602-Lingulodinium_polyedra.AAC.1